MSTKTKTSNKGIKILAVILAVVIVVGLSIFNLVNGKGIFLRAKTAVKSENFSISGTTMGYFGGTTFQQYYSILSYFGADTATSLKEQTCPMLEENGTWFDYFMDATKDTVKEMLALCEYAKANGIKLNEDSQNIIDENMAALAEMAAENNVTVDTYTRAVFLNGINEKDVRNAIELYALATRASEEFANSLDISLEAEEEYYAAHTEDFDGVDYYSYTMTLPTEEESEEDEDNNAAEELGEAVTYTLALQGIKDFADFEAFVRNYEAYLDPDADKLELDKKVADTLKTHAVKADVADEKTAEFLFSAKEGEVFFPETSDGTYTVVVLAKEAYRVETINRNVRHILIEADEENPDDNSAAQAILDELKAADFSEEKWNELAAANSIDTGSNENGGLYENMIAGATYAEFNDWLFDEDRVEGDSGIVKTEAGWHVMYYVGESDESAWMTAAKSGITSEKHEALVEEYSASVEFNDDVIDSIVLN